MRHWLSSQSSVPMTDLDEVAQEVFSRLSRYSDDTLVECPQSFVLRIAANVVDEWQAQTAEMPTNVVAVSADSLDESDTLARQAIAARLRTAIEKLPPRQQQVLTMHIEQDLSYKQIALTLGLAPRIVRRDLARAYAHLRAGLSTADLSVVCDL